jgi:hypothetical protein
LNLQIFCQIDHDLFSLGLLAHFRGIPLAPQAFGRRWKFFRQREPGGWDGGEKPMEGQGFEFMNENLSSFFPGFIEPAIFAEQVARPMRQ